ncbi:MAG: hypothetical protein KGI54_14530 [Pseudomonadota bacterium]|nr:hypothetical protein [Pseudomonadota bacterium]
MKRYSARNRQFVVNWLNRHNLAYRPSRGWLNADNASQGFLSYSGGVWHGYVRL